MSLFLKVSVRCKFFSRHLTKKVASSTKCSNSARNVSQLLGFTRVLSSLHSLIAETLVFNTLKLILEYKHGVLFDNNSEDAG